MFTETELVSIRKYCGYGARTAVGFNFQANAGTLEVFLHGLKPEEEAVIRDEYLPQLRTFESALNLVGDNLDTDVAAVWTRNKNQLSDRLALYGMSRRQLCEFIGITPGPGMSGGSFSIVRC